MPSIYDLLQSLREEKEMFIASFNELKITIKDIELEFAVLACYQSQLIIVYHYLF